VAFTDINLYYEVPRHFRDVPAIGPGGKFTGRTYGEYAEESKRFLRALFEVYLEGDSRGQPFFFPKPLLHITDAFFEEPGWEEMLALASLVAAEKGNTYFVFDRGGVAKLSECCRLSFELTPEDLLEAKTPWKMRYSALQNVTINLPRLAIKAERNMKLFYSLLDEMVELAIRQLYHRFKVQCRLRVKDIPFVMGQRLYMGSEDLKPEDSIEPAIVNGTLSVGIIGLAETLVSLTGYHHGQSEE